MKRKPNVLLISCDQLRPDVFGFTGNEHIQTPHLNEIAAASVRFTNAVSECPVCVPARKILMTGKDAYLNEQFDNSPPSTFIDRGPFLAECFGKAGYQTQAIGKMHVSPPRFRMGFDHVLLSDRGRDSCRQSDYTAYLQNEGVLEKYGAHSCPANGYASRPDNMPEENLVDTWASREACRFFERRDPTAPFFLYVSFNRPHQPLAPPQYYWDLYKDKPTHIPVRGDWLERNAPAISGRDQLSNNYDCLTEEEKRQAIRAYYGLVTYLDHQIGNIMGTLDHYWLTGDTIVMFVADHGEMLFDHDGFRKSKYYRSSAGIPFLIMPPRNTTMGIYGSSDRYEPVILADVMPTLLDLCGIPIPGDCTGKSLLPVLKDPNTKLRTHVFGRHGTRPDDAKYVIQTSKWKYLYYVEGGIEQLFDVKNDYYDCHDLSQSPTHTKIRNELRNRLIDELKEKGDGNVIDGELRKAKPRYANLDAPRRYNNNGIKGYDWPSTPFEDVTPHESYRNLYYDYEEGEVPQKPYILEK
jgi:arylsulfatase